MNNKRGFTLVELLAVIVVLAIVMLVVANRVGDAMLKSRGNSLAIQVKSLARETEKEGIMDNKITTKQIDGIVSKGDLKFVGYIKAVTGIGSTGKKFENDAIVVQAQEGSKFANIAFTDDIKNLGTIAEKIDVNLNEITLGNSSVENNKDWLKQPILYFETTVPIDDSTPVAGIIKFENINELEDGKGQEGENTPVTPEQLPKVYAVGDEVCLNGSEDCFNVINDNGDSITMLAKNVLTKAGLTQTTSTNYSDYGVPFANKDNEHKHSSGNYLGYWTDDSGNLLSTYKNENNQVKYTVYVYDKNSNTHNIVGEYVKKLKKIKKIPQNDETSLTGRLISNSELEKLVCPSNGGDCPNEWLKNGQNWWSGSAGGSNTYYDLIIYVNLSGKLDGYHFWSNEYGVRPVITVLKSKI